MAASTALSRDDCVLALLQRLDAQALAAAEATCATWRRQTVAARLWQELALHLWSWFVPAVPRGRTWKWLCFRLDRCAKTSAAQFFVIGSLSPSLRQWGSSGALSFGLSTGRWADAPAPQHGRNLAGIVREPVTGGLVVVGGLRSPGAPALKSVELLMLEEQSMRVPHNAAPQTRADEESFFAAFASAASAAAWSWLPEMMVARCGCAAAADSRGRIYAAGGGEHMYRSAECWSSLEVLDLESCLQERAEQPEPPGGPQLPWAERWREGPAMNDRRCALGLAYSAAADCLFAAGGYGGGSSYLATAERLDLSSGAPGAWERLPEMSCKRAGCNAVVGPDQRVFVVGGGPDGNVELDTMEALDPREGRWQTDLAPLLVGRHYNAAAFGPDGRLYVAGTFRHAGQLDVVERYDPRANAWEELPPMGAPLCFSAGAFLF